MRVVLDTNFFLSALITKGGVAAQIVEAWLAGDFVLLTNDRQLDELRTVTRRSRIRALTRPAPAGRLVNQLRADAEFVDRLPTIQRSADPADDFLLGISEAGEADYLVTGDKPGLLVLKSHGRTAIVTARGFLDLLSGA